MQTITYFNALILRGSPEGITGAAITRMTEYRDDDGKTLAVKESDAIPVALAAQDPGIPLVEILGEVNTQALASIEALTTERDELAAAHTAALEQVEALTAQLAEYQTPVDANGVPRQVTMRQAQLALLGAGLLDDVEAAIAAIPGDAGRVAQITWTKSSTVQRDNPLIVQLAGGLGLTSEQIDALFVTAATL